MTFIDQRLECILQQLARREVAQLSQTHGIQTYAEYTVRLACSDGRLPTATKRENGTWSIPRDAALRILQDGLPPERRNGRSDSGHERACRQ